MSILSIRTTRSILAGCLALTVAAGCSAKTEEQATPKLSEAAGKEQKAADPQNAKYDPPIEITTAKQMYNAAKFVGGQTNDKNVWTDLFERELGIKLKYAWTTPEGADYKSKVNVTIASNALPDFMQVNDSQLGQLAENELIADLTEVYNKYASPDLKKVMDNAGNALKMATLNGKLMALPLPAASVDQAQLVWIRADWLKKLNLPEPKTMADLYAISEAFATKDPDDNGKADTYGIALYKSFNTNNASLMGFVNGFHAYYDQWIEDKSGNLVYSSIQPEMKAALLKLKEMYKVGQIDKEFSVKDRTKAIQDLSSGKNGINFATFSAPTTTYQAGYDLDPKTDWKPYPLLSVDGSPVKAQITPDAAGYFAVSKASKHPEALILLANKVIEQYKNMKTADDPYFFSINNYHLYTDLGSFIPTTRNLEKYKAIDEAMKSKLSDKLTGDQLTDYNHIQSFLKGESPKMWSVNKIYGEGGAFSINQSYYDKGLYSRSLYYGPPTPSMIEKKASLDTLQSTVFTKIIMGNDAPDEFEKFVSDWSKLGGEQITKEVNEWYRNNK
ncbi:putative aldouronate transport system substrate-binding protein [Paenibacillus sp. UNCCL117]|uniref:extracellular solute-binding protein n=1 Tax=unclassified Paenibacillus TaxID=185978 RepID=UPI000884C16E|nr:MULTISPECIES: extracellular solute-binding protein [unclassified Paenibacillus]SDE26646.1 putative aldouronate transport system substrate-binding protein [Paenibacillus sp. cl123]SFW62673.1 putative aldouronate transport system substrate-binding protein [Paenibacillus sp. UNCCL117]